MQLFFFLIEMQSNPGMNYFLGQIQEDAGQVVVHLNISHVRYELKTVAIIKYIVFILFYSKVSAI